MTYRTVEELATAGGISTIEAGRPDDIYIAAASFEPRGIALTGMLAPDYEAAWGFTYVNEDFLSGPAATAVQASLDVMRTALEPKSQHFHTVRGSWEDASQQVRALRSAFGMISPNPQVVRITIDATTFNRESLIVCLALLRAQFSNARIRLLYVAPEQHGTWLSRGFRKVRSIVGYAGVQQPSRATVLFALSGFEGDRTVKIIEEYEPSRVFLGIGDPPTIPSFLERNLSEHKLVLSRTDVQDFRFPADNIRACTSILENLINDVLKSANVVVAPMSTKLSTVAAFIVAERHPEVQIAYCLPGEYNSAEYSAGMSRVFIEEL